MEEIEIHNIVKVGAENKVIGAEVELNIDVKSVIFMNMWRLKPKFYTILEKYFYGFEEVADSTDLKRGYLLLTVIGHC